jgi:hypothetical protein
MQVLPQLLKAAELLVQVGLDAATPTATPAATSSSSRQ